MSEHSRMSGNLGQISTGKLANIHASQRPHAADFPALALSRRGDSAIRRSVAGAGILVSLAALMSGCSKDPEYTRYCVIDGSLVRVDDDYCEDNSPGLQPNAAPSGGSAMTPGSASAIKYVWYYTDKSQRVATGSPVSRNGSFTAPASGKIKNADGGGVSHGGFGSGGRKGGSSGS